MAISAKRVSELLAGPGELALLDVREQGVHYRGHPFFACAAPLSRLGFTYKKNRWWPANGDAQG